MLFVIYQNSHICIIRGGKKHVFWECVKLLGHCYAAPTLTIKKHTTKYVGVLWTHWNVQHHAIMKNTLESAYDFLNQA